MKKFLCGVADAYFYSTAEEILFVGKTMLDNSIEINVNNTVIEGGKGSPKQFVYFHGATLDVTLTETQFSLDYIAANLGEGVVTGTDMFFEENVTLTAGGAGAVTYTPKVTPDGNTTIYGWVTQQDGTVTKVTFSTKDFTLAGGATNEVVCVRYYRNDAAARYVEVPANIIPTIGRLVLDAQLFSSNSGDANGATLIGKVQVEISRAQLSGAQTISMSSTGVSNTPLKATALAYNEAGCNGSGTYAKIIEKIDSDFWYTNIRSLSIADDTITLANGTTQQLYVYAIPYSGSAFLCPVADLTFSSSVAGDCTVSAGGLLTWISDGASVISVAITNKNTVTCSIQVTCSV